MGVLARGEVDRVATGKRWFGGALLFLKIEVLLETGQVVSGERGLDKRVYLLFS